MSNSVYAGSFDPPTRGHEWVLREATRILGEPPALAVARNAGKKALGLLRRTTKYIHEDRATTERATRLERVTTEINAFLAAVDTDTKQETAE